jgi:hypothetical protein
MIQMVTLKYLNNNSMLLLNNIKREGKENVNTKNIKMDIFYQNKNLNIKNIIILLKEKENKM